MFVLGGEGRTPPTAGTHMSTERCLPEEDAKHQCGRSEKDEERERTMARSVGEYL